MINLVVRQLLIDLAAPPARHWCGNDAFRTALFNALSMSFPVGEQFFIDAAKNALRLTPGEQRARWEEEVRGFVGQEATHRRIHALFNDHLERQGLVNAWAQRAEKRVPLVASLDPRHGLAITAATEHFTAILADYLLGNEDLLDGAEPRLKTMWLWHSAEESEHRCTAFDLYHAVGGDYRRRRLWFWRVTWMFCFDLVHQTLSNLAHDGQLWRLSTWRSAASFLLGRRGLLRLTLRPWSRYLRRDFHPGQQDDQLSRQWLARHADQFRIVGAAREPACTP
ncbi:MAG: hypothetical protein JWP36_134 [Paucimonas sp.]|nr:hypothetical protein [Paucimonas sp.]